MLSRGSWVIHSRYGDFLYRERRIDGLTDLIITTRHQMRIHPQREPRIIMTKTLRDPPNIRPVVQQQRRIRVPQHVHAVHADIRETGGADRGLPDIPVEMVASQRVRSEEHTSELQSPCNL